MSIFQSSQVRHTLERLFAATEAQEAAPSERPAGFAEASARMRADLMADVYMPVSSSGGDLLYALARSARADTMVEFGTSFGISTIFLAAAAADNGKGHVYTTELSEAKIKAARANLIEAGLGSYVTILGGDARESLGAVAGPIGLALLDGWKNLCLPVLKLLEAKLASGAIVVGDDSSFSSMADYVAYVRDSKNGYVSIPFPVEDGMEISCRIGAA